MVWAVSAFGRLTRCYELEARVRMLPHLGWPRWRRALLRRRLELERHLLSHHSSTANVPAWRLWLRQLRTDRPPPDFAVMAPIKSGSSDFFSRLLLHPGVLAPLARELDGADPSEWTPYYPTAAARAQARRRHGAALCPYLGHEFDWPELAEGLAAARPHAKIIILLRDPVERAHSHWKWEVLLGAAAARVLPYYRDFSHYVDLAVAAWPEIPMMNFSGFDLLSTGAYEKGVALWTDRFGEGSVLVQAMEPYFEDPARVLDRVQRFLGLPRAELGSFAGRVNENPLRFPPMEDRTRRKLAEFYRPHNEALYAALGVDLGWTRD